MRPRNLLFAIALFQLACAGAAPPITDRAPAPDARPGDPPLLEERALLLLLEDRKLFEPVVIARFEQGSAELRELLAMSLGRIGDPQGRPYLEILLADAEPAVRRAAAFGLGELGEKAAVTALLRAAADPDQQTGTLAVEALAKLEAPLPDVDRALLELPETQRWPRLLPALFRFKAPGVVPLAQAGLALDDPELHFRAAYALSREPRPEGAPLLRRLLDDSDPLVRGWAARGLGAVGEGSDLALLRPLLDDAETTPVIQALRAARRLIAEGKAGAPVEWVPRLLELFSDARNGIAITAIEASGLFLNEERLATALRDRARSADGRLREVALLALADGKDAQAAELAAHAALAAAPPLRMRAAEAAGRLGALELLAPLAKDPVPGVRAAALQARLDALTPTDPPAADAAPAGAPRDLAAAGAAARAALADADPVVRATALGWLAEHAVAPLVDLDRANAAAQRDEMNDARIAVASALRARAQAEALERGAAVASLERLATDRDYLVRREAAKELGALDQPVPPLGPATAGRELLVYRDIVRQTAAPREAEITTRHGVIRLRLACPQAPLTCLNFLQLAGQGYFDGVSFHRVVPDFVVQGGDPRGDGSGGPGFAIRDEINTLRYHRGAVGMALSGPDTGGSQFFITLTRQPHLDGGYTIFGEVIAGMAAVDRIVQGDVMVRVTPVPVP